MQMKNWLPAEFGSLVRAIDRMPASVQAVVEFRIDVVARSAGASSVRAACLDDEAGDDPVSKMMPS